MKREFLFLIGLFLIMNCTGCFTTTGLSPRETGVTNFTDYVYYLYDEKPHMRHPRNGIRRPIKLAVAQIGENAPEAIMLSQLSQQKNLIRKINAIPAGTREADYYSNGGGRESAQKMKNNMRRIRQIATDLGADYLFLFGGAIDTEINPTPLQFFDLTIIGGYILPGTRLTAEGQASGALIDVINGDILFFSHASATISKHSPSFLNPYGQNQAALAPLKEELVVKLADDFIQKLSKVESRAWDREEDRNRLDMPGERSSPPKARAKESDESLKFFTGTIY